MDDIFIESLQALKSSGRSVPEIVDPTSPHSGFGRGGSATVEVLGWRAATDRIRRRLLWNPARAAWLDQAIGMCLWNLAASQALKPVAFYNPNAARFSDDGRVVRAPWGFRMLAGHESSALARALELLRRDPSSLRAVVPVFEPHDLGVATRDMPCLLAIHCLVRERALHFNCFFRSVNPYWVWPYDHFFLTVLLEFAASVLAVKPGSLIYTVSSLQLPVKDAPLRERALGAPRGTAPAMPPMAPGQSWPGLKAGLAMEPRVRALLARELEGAADPEAWQASMAAVEEPWQRGLFQALAYAFLARRQGAMPQLPFPCPAWAQPFVARAAESRGAA